MLSVLLVKSNSYNLKENKMIGTWQLLRDFMENLEDFC